MLLFCLCLCDFGKFAGPDQRVNAIVKRLDILPRISHILFAAPAGLGLKTAESYSRWAAISEERSRSDRSAKVSWSIRSRGILPPFQRQYGAGFSG